MITSRELKQFVAEPFFDRKLLLEKNSNFPKISIIVPSYNQGEYLERTLLSILNQNYPNTEIIVIDGGSNDSTTEVIKKYEEFIDFWVSEKDSGQSNALNKGFDKASGDIYGWQNSDDIYLPGVFQKVLKLFGEMEHKKVIYGNWVSIDQSDNIVDKTFALPPVIPHFPYENMDSYNQTMFWRRDVHERFGIHDENLHRVMDNDMILRFILREGVGSFHKMDEFTGAFRRYEGQKTSEVAIDEVHLKEEAYLEEKLGFPPRNSFFGIFYRIRYRVFKLYHSLKEGGVKYTLDKIREGLRRKKSLL